MSKLSVLIFLVLVSCSSTENVSVKNNTKIDEIYFENQELKEDIISLKTEIHELVVKQNKNNYNYRKRNRYPERLSIWIKIKNGRIHSNRIEYYNLPGRIVFDKIKKSSNNQSIIYLKNTHTDARWYFYVPLRDGAYNITANLLE